VVYLEERMSREQTDVGMSPLQINVSLKTMSTRKPGGPTSGKGIRAFWQH